ncbi:MAG: endolytic transglycosylase MltG [Candidatus Acidulodesulfobacterium sp.]
MCYFDYTLYKRIKKITFILKILIPIIIIGYIFLYAFTPQSFIHSKTKIIVVNKGSSLKEIVYKLYNKKVINNPYLFYFIGFISGYSRYIQEGTYYISINESPAEIYHELVNGRVATAKVSIPPGLNIFEIAEILSKNHITDKKLFLKKCYDKKFLLSIKVDAPSAEGFLYPDTYIFKINSNPKDVIKDMVNNFYSKTKKIKPDYKDLIIASLIIKEADEKRKNSVSFISSVIHNRLKINMPLDIDSTSIYAMNVIMYKNYLGNGNTYKIILHMKPKYLKIKSAYNTYLKYGLPPTPIANPDLESIEAAIHPSKTKYLYYISTKNGKTLFSDNLSGQIKNIDKYLK